MRLVGLFELTNYLWRRSVTGGSLGAPTPNPDSIRRLRKNFSGACALTVVLADFDRQFEVRRYLAVGEEIGDHFGYKRDNHVGRSHRNVLYRALRCLVWLISFAADCVSHLPILDSSSASCSR